MKGDFDKYSPYVKEGGVIALHDTAPHIFGILEGFPLKGIKGCKKVAYEIINSPEWTNKNIVGTITYATKGKGRISLKCHLKMIGKHLAYWIYLVAKNIPLKSQLKRLMGFKNILAYKKDISYGKNN